MERERERGGEREGERDVNYIVHVRMFLVVKCTCNFMVFFHIHVQYMFSSLIVPVHVQLSMCYYEHMYSVYITCTVYIHVLCVCVHVCLTMFHVFL